MRLRVHNDGRIALQTPAGDWLGMDSPHQATWPEPGWRELVVLDPTTDALRLAKAMGDYVEVAEALLRQLAAGTEGDRNA